jgi:hypothetical protein
VAVFQDALAKTDPAPDWLVTRPGTRLATIRQGRGYAALPPLGRDVVRFEVLTASGDTCGSFDAPSPAPPGGQTWTPHDLFVGQDGTLFEEDGRSGGTLDPSVHCAFRWWPALLK